MIKLYCLHHFFLFAIIILAISSCGNQTGNNNEDSLHHPIVLSDLSISRSQAIDPELIQNAEEAYRPGKILISSQFNQEHPFNQYLPKIDNQFPPIGCTNAALIGLLHYYRKVLTPTGLNYQNKGDNSIQLLPFEILSGIANLSEQINSFSAWWEQDLVARLALYLTAINRTELDLNGSSSSIAWENMSRHFGITKRSTLKFSPTTIDTNVKNLIVSELNAKRPLLLHLNGGLNHLSLIDGYKYDEAGTLFVHINFEWDGVSNGWYDLSRSISKKVVGDDGESITKTAAYYTLDSVIICPNVGCQEASDPSDLHQGHLIRGNLADNDDVDLYPIAIQGDLSLLVTGYQRGMFLSLFNSLGQLVYETRVESALINIKDLSKGNYQIRIARSTVPAKNKSTSFFEYEPIFPMSYSLSYSMKGEGPRTNLPTGFHWANFPENMGSTPEKAVISSPLMFFDGIKIMNNFQITFLTGEELGFFTLTPDKRLKLIPNGQSGIFKIKVEVIGTDGEIVTESAREWEVILKDNMNTGPIGATQIVSIADLNYGELHEVTRDILVQGPCFIEGGPWDSILLAPTKIVKDAESNYDLGVKSGAFGSDVTEPVLMKLVISVPKSPRFSSSNVDQKHYFARISCPELNTTAMNLDLSLEAPPQ